MASLLDRGPLALVLGFFLLVPLGGGCEETGAIAECPASMALFFGQTQVVKWYFDRGLVWSPPTGWPSTDQLNDHVKKKLQGFGSL